MKNLSRCREKGERKESQEEREKERERERERRRYGDWKKNMGKIIWR